MILLALMASCLVACKPSPATPDPISPQPDEPAMTDKPTFELAVTRARYFETNPSLPPAYQSKDEWLLRGEEVENWSAAVADLLDKTTVNGEMTVREHAQMLATDDAAGLKRLELPEGVARVEPTGAPTVEFELYDAETMVYAFRSGLDYEGSAYRSFIKLVQQKGEHTSIPIDGQPKPVKAPAEESD